MTSTGEWIPQTQTPAIELSTDRLRVFTALTRQDEWDAINSLISPEDQAWLATAVQGSKEQWLEAAKPLSSGELVNLIKTLATAEMRLPNCDTGAKSPVIHLNRLLRQRGHPLDKADLQWLKEHSTNRFLPNGPIL